MTTCDLRLSHTLKFLEDGSGRDAGAVPGKNIWGPGRSSFGRQQRLSEITIEPITSTGSRTTVSSCPVLIGGGQDFGKGGVPPPVALT